ncbi:MAG: hypothetical protein PHP73_07450 [Candidatus Omnitrophica bacterium]|nr:hypothetical protein [Candidatus Omnitrophota bacterium]
MTLLQKLYQIEYLVKKAIETEDVMEREKLLLKMGSVLRLKIPAVEKFEQNIIRQLY